MVKCIVIGNGPSILKRELANKIDSYDTVIRCNQYRTAGYEKHIGTKTDIWAIETKCFALTGLVEQEGLVMPGAHHCVPEELEKEFAQRFITVPEVWLVPSLSYFGVCGGSLEKITNQVKSLRDNFHIFSKHDILAVSRAMCSAFPSTGAMVITRALQLYDTIDITGFDYFKGMPGGYWEAECEMGPHNPLMEEIYISQFVKENKVKII